MRTGGCQVIAMALASDPNHLLPGRALPPWRGITTQLERPQPVLNARCIALESTTCHVSQQSKTKIRTSFLSFARTLRAVFGLTNNSNWILGNMDSNEAAEIGVIEALTGDQL
jgi:hypothetical protein